MAEEDWRIKEKKTAEFRQLRLHKEDDVEEIVTRGKDAKGIKNFYTGITKEECQVGNQMVKKEID